MAFSKCPECGETNYEEDTDGLRIFDCGFESEEERRVSRCDNPDPRVQEIPAEIARYRLALFDCAQAAETIGNDMQAKGVAGEFTERCRDLARQMRDFAGNSDDFGGPGQGPGSGGTPASKVLSILRKPWSK